MVELFGILPGRVPVDQQARWGPDSEPIDQPVLPGSESVDTISRNLLRKKIPIYDKAFRADEAERTFARATA